MSRLNNYIASKKNLLPDSAVVGILFLLFTYIISHFLSYDIMAEEVEPEKEKAEIHEIVKLQPKKPKKFVRKKSRKKNRQPKAKTKSRSKKTQTETSAPKINVKELLQSMSAKSLVQNQKTSSRSRPGRHSNISNVKVNANASPHSFDRTSNFSAAVAAGSHRGSAGAPGNAAGAGIGAGIDVGEGSGAGLAASGATLSAGSGVGRRSGRRSGNGAGSGTTIGIPGLGGGGGGEDGVDIHDLIKWMKKHPGNIPRLVQHDMNHAASDLSSAITFRIKGRSYQLFLSCNAKDMLLRICLIEGKDFTLLKDNGIKAESTYLSTGDVVRNGSAIKSLITARRAPGSQASAFYSIFWSWWEDVRG